jgi:predicted phage tail protein
MTERELRARLEVAQGRQARARAALEVARADAQLVALRARLEGVRDELTSVDARVRVGEERVSAHDEVRRGLSQRAHELERTAAHARAAVLGVGVVSMGLGVLGAILFGTSPAGALVAAVVGAVAGWRLGRM